MRSCGIFVLFPFVFVAQIAAHGYVKTVSVDGTSYAGNIPYRTPSTASPIRLINDVDPVLGTSNTNLVCGQGTENAALVVPANPGSKVAFTWVSGTGGNWPHNTGPLMTYMALCEGTTCDKYNATDANWFKVDQAGKKSDGSGWWQQDIMEGKSYTESVSPSSTPAPTSTDSSMIVTSTDSSTVSISTDSATVPTSIDSSTSVPTTTDSVTVPTSTYSSTVSVSTDTCTETSAPVSTIPITSAHSATHISTSARSSHTISASHHRSSSRADSTSPHRSSSHPASASHHRSSSRAIPTSHHRSSSKSYTASTSHHRSSSRAVSSHAHSSHRASSHAHSSHAHSTTHRSSHVISSTHRSSHAFSTTHRSSHALFHNPPVVARRLDLPSFVDRCRVYLDCPWHIRDCLHLHGGPGVKHSRGPLCVEHRLGQLLGL